MMPSLMLLAATKAATPQSVPIPGLKVTVQVVGALARSEGTGAAVR